MLMGSSPELSAGDRIEIEKAHADIGHRTALAEKVRQEVELAREQDRLRKDPNAQADYASYAAGVPTASGRQFRRFREGDYDVDEDTGDTTLVSRPEVTPDQEHSLSSHLASLLGMRMATGRTNADQLSQAGGNLMLDAVRRHAAGMTSAAEQNQAVGPYRQSNREPFSNINTQGMVTNQETGTAAVGDKGIYDAAVAASRALAGQRGASAGLSAERTADLSETRPSRIERGEAAADSSRASAETRRNPRARPAPGRTPGQEARDAAYAAKAKAEAERLQRDRDRKDKAEASRQFKRDPKLKGMTPGAWVPGRGLEARRADGTLAGYVTPD